MVIVDILSQHAEEAAFLWTARDRAVSAPHYALKGLASLDERLDAHLDGLRIAGDAGWTTCRATLENAGPGEIFALAVLAFGTGDRQRMLDVLSAGCVSAETRRGLVSALGWLEYRTVSRWVGKLLGAKASTHRILGVAACAIRREDPAAVLTAAIEDPDPALRSRALRAAGELKRGDLLDGVRGHLSDEDESCRFWAAWTLTLCRHRGGLPSLVQWLGHESRFGRPALQLSMRTMTLEEGRQWIRTLAQDPALRHSAVVAAGALGDPACIPWLIGLMESPELSRAAGEAFSMLTGVDLVDKNLDQDGPSGSQEGDGQSEIVGSPADDEHLPWPRPELIDEWWKTHQGDFRHAPRYLAGRPIDERAVRQLLVTGNQRQRAAAAIELALTDPEASLFEVRARGSDQRALLGIQG
jgi:uncharacterized protein (TIGR02270 family)